MGGALAPPFEHLVYIYIQFCLLFVLVLFLVCFGFVLFCVLFCFGFVFRGSAHTPGAYLLAEMLDLP